MGDQKDKNESKKTDDLNIKSSRSSFAGVLKTELYYSVARDRKHLLRFILVCFMSFFYGIICITGIWNPTDHIDKVPVAIFNNDAPTCIAFEASSAESDDFIENSKEIKIIDMRGNNNVQSCSALSQAYADSNQWPGHGFRYGSFVDDVVQNMSVFNKATQSITSAVGSIKVNINYLFENQITEDSTNNYWVRMNVPQDYTPNMYDMLRGLNNINADGNTKLRQEAAKKLIESIQFFGDEKNKISLWATYQHNFMIGNIMNMLQSTFNGLATVLVPVLAPEAMFWFTAHQTNDGSDYYIVPYNIYDFFGTIANNIDSYDDPDSGLYDVLKTLQVEDNRLYNTVEKMLYHLKNDIILSFIGRDLHMKDLIPAVFNIMFPDLGPVTINDKPNPKWLEHVSWDSYKNGLLSFSQYLVDNWNHETNVPTHFQGYQFSEYGYGFGLYFISIALWTGGITQTFIFRKRSYVGNAKWYQYYGAKWMVMVFTTIVQVLLLFLGLLAVGYGSLGTSIIYMFLWMLLIGIVLITIIQGIWYALPDDNTGRFICVIYTVLNLTAGGGTFSTVLQAPFFQWISYIVPFKYTIKGLSNIVYGVASNEGITSVYNNEIITSFLALLAFVALFLLLGFGTSYVYRRISMYGTFKLSIIYEIMNELKETENFIKSKRVINNMSEEYTQLVAKYVQAQVRILKMKSIRESLNKLYKDRTKVILKHWESQLDNFKQKYINLKEKYQLNIAKYEITKDEKDMNRIAKYKQILVNYVHQIQDLQNKIADLKANPYKQRALVLQDKYNALSKRCDAIHVNGEGLISLIKALRKIRLQETMKTISTQIHTLMIDSKPVFVNMNSKLIISLKQRAYVCRYNFEKMHKNGKNANNEKKIAKNRAKMQSILMEIRDLEENPPIANKHLEDRIKSMRNHQGWLENEREKCDKLAKLMKDNIYVVKSKKLTVQISNTIEQINHLQRKVDFIIQNQNEDVINRFKFNRLRLKLHRLETNYQYDDSREGIA